MLYVLYKKLNDKPIKDLPMRMKITSTCFYLWRRSCRTYSRLFVF